MRNVEGRDGKGKMDRVGRRGGKVELAVFMNEGGEIKNCDCKVSILKCSKKKKKSQFKVRGGECYVESLEERVKL